MNAAAMNDEVKGICAFTSSLPRSDFILNTMTPLNGQRHEHAEHGVRNRIIACRRRLRRIRAAQKAAGSFSSAGALVVEDAPVASAVEGVGGLESAGLLTNVRAVHRYLERRR